MTEVVFYEQMQRPVNDTPEAGPYFQEAINVFPPDLVEASGEAAKHILQLLNGRLEDQYQLAWGRYLTAEPSRACAFVIAHALQTLDIDPDPLRQAAGPTALPAAGAQAAQVLTIKRNMRNEIDDEDMPGLMLACLGATATFIGDGEGGPFPMERLNAVLDAPRVSHILRYRDDNPNRFDAVHSGQYDLIHIGSMDGLSLPLPGEVQEDYPNAAAWRQDKLDGLRTLAERLKPTGKIVFTREGTSELFQIFQSLGRDAANSVLAQWREKDIAVTAHPTYMLSVGTYTIAPGHYLEFPVITIGKKPN